MQKIIDYQNMQAEEFKWEKPEARAVMYCYRLSEYGKLNEEDTYKEWKSMAHSFSNDRKWFSGLYQYMISVIDKCHEIGYNAYKEADISSVKFNKGGK